MRTLPLLLAAAVTCVAVAACNGGDDDDVASPTPLPAVRLRLVSPVASVFESALQAFSIEVVDSSGQVVTTWNGTVGLAADYGPVTPATITVTAGAATADVTMIVGGDNYLTFTAAGLIEARTNVYVNVPIPIRVPGARTGGSMIDEGFGTWNTGGAWAPSVLVSSTGYVMWYSSTTAAVSSNIGMARSPDGVTWTPVGIVPVLGPAVSATTCHQDGAGFPAVYRMPNGSLAMLYRGRTAGRTHLCRATSADGVTWSPAAGVEEDGSVFDRTPGKFDADEILGAGVVRLDDGTYGAIYGGRGVGEVAVTHAGPESLAGFGVATSPDGITWTRVPGPQTSLEAHQFGFAEAPYTDWDSYEKVGPGLFKDGPVFRLWISGNGVAGRLIGYYASIDFESWRVHIDGTLSEFHESYGRGPIDGFDDLGVSLPSVVESLDGTQRRMYYTGTRVSDGTRRIGLADF